MAEFTGFVKRALQWGLVLVAGLVVLSLIVPRVGDHGPSKRTECLNNLHNIALALMNYHSTYGSLPPPYIADASGRPMHSWRVLMLPYLNSGIHWMEPRDLHVEQMSRTINSRSGQGISSMHSGLACVAFADGRARVLADTTPAATIDAMLTIRGGEKIPDND